MTPSARLAAAIDILDGYLAGVPAEKVLTSWARSRRFAGSSDRAAIRDIVFDALRRLRSQAHIGGALTGRGLVIGGLRLAGLRPEDHFTGLTHAPPPLTCAETAEADAMKPLVRLDCPDWLGPHLQAALNSDFEPVMQRLRHRAPVFLRVNLLKCDVERAISSLSEDGIETSASTLSETALEVISNARRVAGSRAYRDGLVELQDASSQAVIDALPLRDAQRILDFCAGGGGKSLAIAARARVTLFAHDIDPRRMTDLPNRAARAGAVIVRLLPDQIAAHGPYDIILADAPCSGSGSWRRSPEGKWALTAERLNELCIAQGEILRTVAHHLTPQGILAYATCSMLTAENEDCVNGFLRETSSFQLTRMHRWSPLDGGDGFFLALLKRNA